MFGFHKQVRFGEPIGQKRVGFAHLIKLIVTIGLIFSVAETTFGATGLSALSCSWAGPNAIQTSARSLTA